MNLRTIILPVLITLITTSFACSYSARSEDNAPVPGDAPDERMFDFTDEVTDGNAENIILVIADGMQLENIHALRLFLGAGNPLPWDEFEYSGYATTWDIDTYNRYAARSGEPAWSPDSFDPLVGYDPERGGDAPWPVSDIPDPDYFFRALPEMDGGDDTYAIPAACSASAGTAIATGCKTCAGNVSWLPGDPSDGQIETIAEIMRNRNNAAIGIVTTVQFSHATPAVFVAHNTSRGNTTQIAHEILNEFRPEVVLGGGHPDYIGGYISSDDYRRCYMSDNRIFHERAEGRDGGAGLLEVASVAVSIDGELFGLYGGANGHFDDDLMDPDLSEAVTAAFEVLSTDPDGFFLMAEQGDLDWANHYNDYHWMIDAMVEFGAAVSTIVELVNRPDDSVTWDNTLLIITADHATGGLRILDESLLTPGTLPEMTGERYHYEFPGGEVSYMCTTHTNEPVPLFAHGKGADLFRDYEGAWYPGTRIVDNTHIFEVMTLATIPD